MAAPRRWSDRVRGEIWRLAQEGQRPAEIARRLAQGTALVAPTQIPRRTVADIVVKARAERGQEDLPHRFEDVMDADSEELIERYPKVVLGLVQADSERLRHRGATKGLSLDDYNRLRAGLGITQQIAKLHDGRRRAASPERKRLPDREDQTREEGGLIEWLVREGFEEECHQEEEGEQPLTARSAANAHGEPNSSGREMAGSR